MISLQNNYANSGELKEKARDQLRGKWATPIFVCLAAFVVLICGSLCGNLLFSGEIFTSDYVSPRAFLCGSLLNLLIESCITLGVAMFFLKFIREENYEFGDVFAGFKYFVKAFLLILLTRVLILLWSLLFIIPGFIAAFRYRMCFYILADDPEMSVIDAYKQSKEMMNGHKMRLFILGLSFLGWMLLGFITLGIGLIWAMPYYNAAEANFYEELKLSQTEPIDKKQWVIS